MTTTAAPQDTGVRSTTTTWAPRTPYATALPTATVDALLRHADTLGDDADADAIRAELAAEGLL
jgi:hypothetical protein